MPRADTAFEGQAGSFDAVRGRGKEARELSEEEGHSAT